MIIQKPVLSEKSQREYQKKNKVCVFYVNPRANKFQIKKAVEDIFKVKVKKVRTSCQKSILQKTSLLRKLPGRPHTKLKKKAFVELVLGQELPIFP